MKVHYINILLFACPLNILAHNKNKQSITPHTPKIPSTRLLCECELYTPANYDNDPQMKEVMENFNKQTQQRFHEYNDRMKTTRQKCKDQCDKEIQKIILKDKLEKQMEQQLTTLETRIDTDDIPTCICEKSMADKVEKGCLRCGSILGAAMPELGSIGGSLLYALNSWKPAAITAAEIAAKEAAIAAGKAAGDAAGKKALIDALRYYKIHNAFPNIFNSIGPKIHFTEITKISDAIIAEHVEICQLLDGEVPSACQTFEIKIGLRDEVSGALYNKTASEYMPNFIGTLVEQAKKPAAAETTKVTADKTPIFTTRNIDAVNTAYASYEITIIASIIAIEVIVLIMVIIYLILRYRRKKKMKKKLQYIKLLEE
ncbi:rifin PIR protein, putative [Plasmodium reichenowi]|uniref:Rifin PIR protein, putative n=1 Tax=Plasmodium reichenowi TaxID=5854 RepID=A0A2P9DCA5_PLARE|nr:rifin PIR protein, putative [Plasmodium reichenowi]